MHKTWVPLLAAILLGLLAAVFAQRWMKGRIEAAEAGNRDGIDVVVAATVIPFGTKITADVLRTVSWPADSQPEGVFHDIGDVIGKTANQKLVPGEAVLVSRTLGQAGGSSLAALVEPNKRAVTVRVNDVIGVAGFLLPGNRVDVLATRETDHNRAQTRTLLQDVKVLAVDQTAASEKDQPVVVRAITLEVDPRQAELLVQATGEGTVQMSLRNPDDVTVVQSAPAEESARPVAVAKAAPSRPRPQAKAVAAVPAPATPSPPREPEVMVIRQTQVGSTP